MAIEFSSVLDSGDVDSNTTEAVKRQGGLEISDVNDLQTSLDGKSDTGHTHVVGDVTDFPTTMPPSSHTHPIDEVTDLQTELDSKLETVPNATDTVVGGIKIRLDSANSTVYVTTDGSAP
jgi:hypothetical protein